MRLMLMYSPVRALLICAAGSIDIERCAGAHLVWRRHSVPCTSKVLRQSTISSSSRANTPYCVLQ
jgi:hypothetical protein